VIIRLSGKDDRCWALMPKLADRIIRYGVQFDQANVQDLVRKVQAELVLDQNQTALWMAVNLGSSEQVRGHLLASVDQFNGRKTGFIEQLALDASAITPDERQTCITELEHWAGAQGCLDITMMTGRLDRLRAWEHRFGFKPFKAIMRRELPK